MRLLPPQERVSLAQQERERLIKEGVNIAQKVDSLREMREREEKNLREFRDKELLRIKGETESRKSELNGFLKEIDEKRAELEQYGEKSTLNRQWLLYVKSEKETIEKEKQRIAKESQALINSRLAQEEDFRKRELSIRAQTIEAGELELSAKEQVHKAQVSAKEAKEEESRARFEAKRIDKEVKGKEDTAQQKLNELQLREFALKDRESELERREADVLVKEMIYYSPVKQQ